MAHVSGRAHSPHPLGIHQETPCDGPRPEGGEVRRMPHGRVGGEDRRGWPAGASWAMGVSGTWYLCDPGTSKAGGDSGESAEHPTARGQLTQSCEGGSKWAARGMAIATPNAIQSAKPIMCARTLCTSMQFKPKRPASHCITTFGTRTFAVPWPETDDGRHPPDSVWHHPLLLRKRFRRCATGE